MTFTWNTTNLKNTTNICNFRKRSKFPIVSVLPYSISCIPQISNTSYYIKCGSNWHGAVREVRSVRERKEGGGGGLKLAIKLELSVAQHSSLHLSRMVPNVALKKTMNLRFQRPRKECRNVRKSKAKSDWVYCSTGLYFSQSKKEIKTIATTFGKRKTACAWGCSRW